MFGVFVAFIVFFLYLFFHVIQVSPVQSSYMHYQRERHYACPNPIEVAVKRN